MRSSACRAAFASLAALSLMGVILVTGCSNKSRTTDTSQESATAMSDHARTFMVIRHAEKITAADGLENFDAKDPPLTAQGVQRALALAGRLRNRTLTAVYATPFQRTQATAAPSAKAFGLRVQTYAANLAPAEFVAQLLESRGERAGNHESRGERAGNHESRGERAGNHESRIERAGDHETYAPQTPHEAQAITDQVLIVGHSNTVPGIVAALCQCEAPGLGEHDYGDLFEITLQPGAKPVMRHEHF